MKLKWDFHELYDFGEKISDYSKLKKHLEEATRKIAEAFHDMLVYQTPVKTGELVKGWSTGENLAYRVKDLGDIFEVEFSNDVEYAHWVNYGHRVRNGSGGDFGSYYKVKRRTVPYYDGNSSDYFVYGHFFVEKSIVKMENGSHQIDNIVYKELEKWFRWCANGK